MVDGGYTLEQTRDALVTGLHRLLAPRRGIGAEPAKQLATTERSR